MERQTIHNSSLNYVVSRDEDIIKQLSRARILREYFEELCKKGKPIDSILKEIKKENEERKSIS